jgi:two-component system phosphate regulon sensor histidine kinase PhoR
MYKRIFRTMGLLVLLTVLLFSLLGGVAFAGMFGSQVKNGMKTCRVSMIDPQGAVYFDNMVDPSTMENHLNRPEVAAALQRGIGESERFSDTLGEKTYYYAVRLDDGNVLRLALTTDNVSALTRMFVPIIILCFVLSAGFAIVIARNLTKRITAPINGIDLDAPEIGDYDELLPFVKRIQTQKQELTAQLAQIENRTATIFAIAQSMREGLLLVNEEGQVLLANESAMHILGISEAVGHRLIELCRDIVFFEHVKTCLTGEKSEIDMHIKERIYNVFFSPVLEAGIVQGAVVLFIDVTERYAAEAQRKEFSANVSHELKTPLTTITALSEMIEDGTAKEKDVPPFAAKIKNQARRLIDIIDDIIKLSAFDEDMHAQAFAHFNLYDMAEMAIENLREKAAEKNIAVLLEGDIQLFITANMRMIDELLYNLIDNAIKYNRDGGHVTVSLSAEGNQVKIAVTDSGIGIPGAHLPHIFERFYRVDKSRSKKTGGTGLGLSIVKHVAEFHGGHVKAESREGVGTTFTATLPQH